MIFPKLILAFPLTLVFAIVSLPQDAPDAAVPAENHESKDAIKIDEFGRASNCDLGARIDNLFTQLNNNPDAKGYIITYSGLDFLPSDYDRSPMRSRIVKAMTFRQYDTSRISLIDGGFRSTVATEFFLAEPGVAAPRPTETVQKPEMPKKKTFLWGRSGIEAGDDDIGILGEFILPEVKAREEAEMQAGAAEDSSKSNTASDEQISVEAEVALSPEEIQEVRFRWADDGFGSEIARRKKASGVLMLYADDQYYDISRLEYFVEQGKNKIAKNSKIDVSRIQVIFGGYRDFVQAEFWIVPQDGEFPIAKPDERAIPDQSPDDQ